MAHNKLYRNFIILQEDENTKSSSNDKALSGYAKIEAKGDKCKITFYAQNLKKDDDYAIVLICYKKDLKQIIDMGPLTVNEVGKGEACIEYYSDNIAGLNLGYDKISGAGICKKKSGSLDFSMYGFMNGEKLDDGWKKMKVVSCHDKSNSNKSKEYYKKDDDKKHEDKKHDKKDEDKKYCDKDDHDMKDHHKDKCDKDDHDMKDHHKDKCDDKKRDRDDTIDENSIKDNTISENDIRDEAKDYSNEECDNENDSVNDQHNDRNHDNNEDCYIDDCENRDHKKCDSKKKDYEKCGCKKKDHDKDEYCKKDYKKHDYDDCDDDHDHDHCNCHKRDDNDEDYNIDDEEDRNHKKCDSKKKDHEKCGCKKKDYDKEECSKKEYKKGSCYVKDYEKCGHKKKDDYNCDYDDDYYEKEYDKKKYKDHKYYCDRDGLENNFEEYERKIEEQRLDAYDFSLRGEVGNFFENLVKGFEEVKGGFKELPYCKWFKVPIHDIDDMCNSKDYNKYSIIYYPMLNYYPYIKKYGYFMIGYKCDSKGNLKYLVYAIPGKREREEQPYCGKSGFVTWCKRDCDSNGFWLMFYDYKNSTIVVPSK